MKNGLIIFILWIFLTIGLLMMFSSFFLKLTGLVVTSLNTCSDSDGGRNYGVKGHVEGIYYLFREEKFYEEDRCKDNETLIEYYCVQDEMHSYKEKIEYKCRKGCEDGRCLETTIEIPEKISLLNRIKLFFRRLF